MPFRWPTSGIGAVHPLSENPESRQQGIEFLRFAKASVDGIGYREAKRIFDVSRQQAETRKSLYQELGLLYVPRNSDELILTAVGKQILELLGTDPPELPSETLREQVDSLLCWSYGNSQIDRPQSPGSPRPSREEQRNCDIRPYAAFWQAMRDLGGTISFSEFFGVLWHLQRTEQYREATERILESRERRIPLIDPREYQGRGPMMNPRIYWFGKLSIGGAILNVNTEEGSVSFRPERRSTIEAVLDFHVGCSGSREDAFRSRPYTDVHDYYRIAGRACPPFIATGRYRLADIGGANVVLLQGYDLMQQPNGYILDGGPELCRLPMKAQCFHSRIPDRLLRIDAKEEGAGGHVRLLMGLGRIISDPTEFLNAYDRDTDASE